jgi:hypothetical protein
MALGSLEQVKEVESVAIAGVEEFHYSLSLLVGQWFGPMAKLVASELAFLGQWEMDGETVPVLPHGKDVVHPSLPEQVVLAEV